MQELTSMVRAHMTAFGCTAFTGGQESTESAGGRIAPAQGPASVDIDVLAASAPAPAAVQPSPPQTYSGTAQLPHGVAGGTTPGTGAPSVPVAPAGEQLNSCLNC